MAILTPTSWADCAMDWDAPNVANPAYLEAIEMAIIERALVVFDYAIGVDYLLDINMPFSALRARRLGEAIIRLMGYFLIEQPLIATSEYAHYTAADGVLLADPKLADLCVSTGDWIGSEASAKFLLACRYFLDKLIVTDTPYDSQFLYDNFRARDPVNDPFPLSFDDFWDLCITQGNTETDEVEAAGQFGGTFAAAYTDDEKKGLGSSYNVRYLTRQKLAHNLLAYRFFAEAYGKGEDTIQFDFAGFGYPAGWSLAKEVGVPKDPQELDGNGDPIIEGADGAPVLLSATTLQKPGSWPAWANKNDFAWAFRVLFFYDFNVDNGFKFKPDEVTP